MFILLLIISCANLKNSYKNETSENKLSLLKDSLENNDIHRAKLVLKSTLVTLNEDPGKVLFKIIDYNSVELLEYALNLKNIDLKHIYSVDRDLKVDDLDSSNGCTLLMYSAFKERKEIFEFLLSKYANILVTNEIENNVISECIRGMESDNSLAFVEYLINLLSDKKEEITKGLYYAAIIGNIHLLKMLIDRGADINTKCNNPLIGASRFNQIEVINFLMMEGADINLIDVSGIDALGASIESYETFKFILSLNPSITPYVILNIKSYEMLELIIDKIDVNTSYPNGISRIFLFESIKEVILLLYKRALIDKLDIEFKTPLISISERHRYLEFDNIENLNKIKFLLSSGANPSIRDKYRNTAMMYFTEKVKISPSIEFLYKLKSSSFLIGERKYSHVSRHREFISLIPYLIKSESYDYNDAIYVFKNLNTKDKKDVTCLHSYIDGMIHFYSYNEYTKRKPVDIIKALKSKYHIHSNFFKKVTIQEKYISLVKTISSFIAINLPFEYISPYLILQELPSEIISEVIKYI